MRKPGAQCVFLRLRKIRRATVALLRFPYSIALILACAGVFRWSTPPFAALQKGGAEPGSGQTAIPAYLNSAPGVQYVGSQVCASCHRQIYEDYGKTDMGRSMAEANGDALLALARSRASIFDPGSNLYFQVTRRGRELFESVYGSSAAGAETFRHTEKIEYSLGSGVNGIACLIRKGNFLFQAPVAFYTKAHTWGLSPGYKGHDTGFSRAITARCITCHSGLPQPVPNRDGLYRDPPFKELAIACESCHGPGQLHVEARMKGEPVSGDVDPTIVNPAKLPTWLASNVCMYCHEDGDAQVLKPGKSFLDVRPGLPLDNVVALFKLRPAPGSAATSELLDRYGELMASKCYYSSGGRLGCVTCHDPHTKLAPEESVAFYRAKCLSCHTDKSCGLPLKTRLGQSPANDCAGCHMLKQDVSIPHSSVTNHRIVATRGEPYPEFLFREATPGAGDLIHLDAVPGAENVAPAPLTLLQAYRQVLFSTREPKYMEDYLAILAHFAGAQPADPAVLSALAFQAALGRKPAGMDEAIEFLKKAVALGTTDPVDYSVLGELLVARGRPSDAIGVLRAGLSLDPIYIPYYELLANAYMKTGDVKHAGEIINQGVQQFPESHVLRELQEKVREGGGP